jgi:hypothetical protein
MRDFSNGRMPCATHVPVSRKFCLFMRSPVKIYMWTGSFLPFYYWLSVFFVQEEPKAIKPRNLGQRPWNMLEARRRWVHSIQYCSSALRWRLGPMNRKRSLLARNHCNNQLFALHYMFLRVLPSEKIDHVLLKKLKRNICGEQLNTNQYIPRRTWNYSLLADPFLNCPKVEREITPLGQEAIQLRVLKW